MKFNRIVFVSFLSLLPFTAKADITIYNNTNLYITAYANSPCSSGAGKRGIVQPHGQLTIARTILVGYCGWSDCQAHVFMNDHCGAPEVATATINAFKGISSIANKDPAHYLVTYTADTASVTQLKPKTLFEFLFS